MPCFGPLTAVRFPFLESSSEQAHVPAEQPPARQDPWVPAADAHPRRPRDSRRPSPEGPSGPFGLTPPAPGSLVLPAASRLRQRSDFAAAARSGRRAARPRLVVHLLLADAAGAADSTRSSVPTALPTPVPTPLPTPVPTPLPTPGPPRAGFVVGR